MASDILKQLREAIATADEENKATLDGVVDAKEKAEDALRKGAYPL